jgi:signal transduction histidine kinase
MTDQYTILVVDDNANNRVTVKELLANIPKVQVVEASSGEEALLMTLEHKFQLILLDVQMPGMDGYETARLLQMTERTRNIPVIFLTAVFKNEEFVKRGYALGAVDYLTKPLDDNMLLNRVRNYQRLYERECELLDALGDLQAMQESLLQSEKLSALGSIVAGISHELNTPLGNAKLSMSTLRDLIADMRKSYQNGALTKGGITRFFSDAQSVTDLTYRSIDRAVDLVCSFKQVAIDQTTEKRRQFDLARVVEETIATLRPSYINDPWEFVIDIPENCVLDSYPGSLEQILINLVHNSIRHGFQGRAEGRIVISAEWQPCTTYLAHVRLRFSDNGIGIEEQYLSRIFDPFFTTRLGRGGAGIGLNIVYRIVTNLLGGTISVDSKPTAGTTYMICIPIHAPVNACS